MKETYPTLIYHSAPERAIRGKEITLTAIVPVHTEDFAIFPLVTISLQRFLIL